MQKRSLGALAFILVGAAAAVAANGSQGTAGPPDPMVHRGNMTMGFDQEKTTHHFSLYEDGGAIEVSVNDTKDVTNRDAIRSHLPHIAQMFSSGNFDAPMEVHAQAVPGTAEMARLKVKLRFAYVETPRGGRVDIVTTDKGALAAVHAFLKFQVADHKTKDSTKVTKRSGTTGTTGTASGARYELKR